MKSLNGKVAVVMGAIQARMEDILEGRQPRNPPSL
jgi:hypothetical protein